MTRLEQARLDARLTVEQLAEISGVSPRTIRRLEEGAGGHVATLGKLADALDDVRPSELLQDASGAAA